MPRLENPRYEALAQAVVAGMAKPWGERGNGQAYIAAGYTAANRNSADASVSRLLRNVKGILVRVAELQEQARKRAKLTIEDIADELNEARDLALRTAQPSAAVAATATKAKVYGLFVDRLELGKAGDFTKATSPKDLAQRIIMATAPDRIANGSAIDGEAIEAALAELSRHSRAMGDIVDALCARRALPVA